MSDIQPTEGCKCTTCELLRVRAAEKTELAAPSGYYRCAMCRNLVPNGSNFYHQCPSFPYEAKPALIF